MDEEQFEAEFNYHKVEEKMTELRSVMARDVTAEMDHLYVSAMRFVKNFEDMDTDRRAGLGIALTTDRLIQSAKRFEEAQIRWDKFLGLENE